MKPLQQQLSKELGIPVKVHVATNYNAMVEALRSKKVDVAFISPVSYTIAHDKGAADVLLKSKGYLVDDKGNPTNKLVDYYRSQIVVRKDSHLHKLKGFKRDQSRLARPRIYFRIYLSNGKLKKLMLIRMISKLLKLKVMIKH